MAGAMARGCVRRCADGSRLDRFKRDFFEPDLLGSFWEGVFLRRGNFPDTLPPRHFHKNDDAMRSATAYRLERQELSHVRNGKWKMPLAVPAFLTLIIHGCLR